MAQAGPRHCLLGTPCSSCSGLFYLSLSTLALPGRLLQLVLWPTRKPCPSQGQPGSLSSPLPEASLGAELGCPRALRAGTMAHPPPEAWPLHTTQSAPAKHLAKTPWCDQGEAGFPGVGRLALLLSCPRFWGNPLHPRRLDPPALSACSGSEPPSVDPG